ncbi:non-homologous end-joining DNA ligase [Pedobacter gandavensis]|uniref:non-homologous end-joining DNA ligase n=1 Tax=Pedobacter gandavensis TaxID=2679963 RepID=UPI002479555C|nr:non-homologous end-joining DNA ligase [Pedobacter gandavensis]WGQ10692.1 non-homologous end-joining DNA ligase [Pedobacter gandavensis]
MVKRKSGQTEKTFMPEHLQPMLCTLVKEPLESEEYLYELKWDGYRIISTIENSHVRLSSRSGLDYTSRYPLIAEALKKLGHDLMIDGEVVVLNKDGKPDFDTLQLYNGKRAPIRYCVFDLLYLEGNNLMELPLYQRKQLLQTLTKDNEIFLFSESFQDGKALYQKVLKENLEGIVAKKKDSAYQPGIRGYDWLKVPTRKRQEFVIGGWAESDKSRSFKSLLFGAYEKGKLQWIGRSGGGYKQAEMPGILKQLEEIETGESPFENKILDTKGAKTHFVQPKLVANFEFATWTKSGRIRKPATFLGFRKDKDPKDVVREVPKQTGDVLEIIAHQEQPEQPEENANQNQAGKTKEKKIKDKHPDLEKYHDKRSFDLSPEPEGGTPASDKLLFVVQKHNASHLHYDFRLEIRGILKSWAVPKGPSMNPADHRLAMEVEDHPYDYKDFEGSIPEGQYGGGTVLVWDQGSYEPAENISGKKQQERWLLSSYHKNKLSIILNGKKLKGKFNLVKTYGKAENAWLLTKVKDGHELETDITKKDQSVISGYTLLEVAMNSHSKVWKSNRAEPGPSTSKTVKQGAKLTAESNSPKALDQPMEVESQQSEVNHKTVAELFPQSKNKRSTRGIVPATSNWNKIFEEKIKSEGSLQIEHQNLHLSNIEKKLWKNTNKAQLIAYYHSIAKYILPHLKNRPLSLFIKNHSAAAPGFYIKDMEGFQPEFLDIHPSPRKHEVKGKADFIEYPVCNNLPALLWLINLGNIEFNPWNSTTNQPEQPNYIAIDLDPSDDAFKKVIKTALAAKTYFEQQNLTAFIKTSGKTGIHIFIPCKGFNFQQARALAKYICSEIHKSVPMFTTLEIPIDKRGNKLFIDYSQNDFADTLASAYSVRPAKHPIVSTPIEWEELDMKLKPDNYTIANLPARLQHKGDLWQNLHNPKIKTKNSKILKQLLKL